MSRSALMDSQYWLLTVMTASGGLEHGLTLAAARGAATGKDMIAAPPRGAIRDRLGVYHHGYWQRLLECLQADYPLLLRVLEAPLFGFFARAYLARQPSRSPSMYDLGAGFADFLAASLPPQAPAAAHLPVELARLERAYTEALRAPGPENDHAPVADGLMLALAAGSELPLLAVPACVRPLALSLPLLPYWRQLQQDGPVPPAPEPAASYLAVARQHWRVALHPLDPWQYHLLQALNDGLDGPAALQRSATLSGQPLATLTVELLLWLPLAQQLGLLRLAG